MAPRTRSLQNSAILFHLLAVFASLVVCKGGSWPDALWAEVDADSPAKRESDNTSLTPIVFGATKEFTKVLSCR